MSGIYGVLDPKYQIDVDTIIKDMAIQMTHRSWFTTHSFVDKQRNIALGQIGIGIFNTEIQPVWNSSKTIALIMAGELYNVSCKHKNDTHRDELIALCLYEIYGASFAQHLKGAFIIAIFDKQKQRIIIANDRFGLYPLYYSNYGGRLIFAPEMKGVFVDNAVPRQLDLTALTQYMRFQHLLGERTFFEDIKLLPNGSILQYNLIDASLTLSSYWTFADIPYRPDISFNEAVEETSSLLRKTMKQLSEDSHQPGVYLSGGLDSRLIVGLIEHRPVSSLTYGTHNCRDVYYANEVAQKVGSTHYWVDLPNGEWVKEQADFHFSLTEGYHSWIHAHGMSSLPLARKVMDVNLTGWDGGTVMGHKDSIEPLQEQAVDDMALITRLYYLFNQKYTWPSLTEAEERFLYHPKLRPNLLGVAFDSFREEFEKFKHFRSDVRGEYFYLRNHCGRLTQNLITFTRSHVEVRFPFFDYDLIDFLYSVPAQLRGHRTLYYAVLNNVTPQLTNIPYEKDLLLPTNLPLKRSLYSIYRKITNRFHNRFSHLYPPQDTLYANYEVYLRDDLKNWAEAILFTPHSVSHNLFDIDYVRVLFNHHLSSLEEWTIGKIAPLITYEMMLQKFCGDIR